MRREIFQSFGLLIGSTPCVSVRAFSVAAQGTPVETAIPRQNARSKFWKKLYVSESAILPFNAHITAARDPQDV
jgi:hypothetical protein